MTEGGNLILRHRKMKLINIVSAICIMSIVWISTVGAVKMNGINILGIRQPNENVTRTLIVTPVPTVAPTVTPSPTTTPIPVGMKTAEEAKKYLGVPYVWGGATPEGFDCSGLVQYVYKQMGISIARTSYAQVNNGREVQKNELKAGDLVFFADKQQGVHHVAMYVGDGNIIHAPCAGDVVKITPLSSRNDYYSARRIVD